MNGMVLEQSSMVNQSLQYTDEALADNRTQSLPALNPVHIVQ